MARYSIIYWKDIPAQITVSDEGVELSAVLPERFQQSIDAAAMAENSAGEDAYLAGWRVGEQKSRPGSAHQALEALLAELDEAYPPKRLAEIVRAYKIPKSISSSGGCSHMAEHQNLYRRAFYYDIALERDVGREVEFITSVFQHYAGGKLTSVLDLACGPGYHARALARLGILSTGLDASKEMLALAEKKSRDENLQLEWVQADMRSFQLDQPVDMVICMFDSIDTLLTNEDLVQNFRTVAGNLRPGGLYLIDLTHLREVDYNHYGDFRYSGERDGISVEIIWATNKPQFDLISGVAPVEIEIRIQDHAESLTIRDTAKERLLDPQELFLLANLSGVLEVIGWHGDYELGQPLDHTVKSQRMICILRKKKGD